MPPPLHSLSTFFFFPSLTHAHSCLTFLSPTHTPPHYLLLPLPQPAQTHPLVSRLTVTCRAGRIHPKARCGKRWTISCLRHLVYFYNYLKHGGDIKLLAVTFPTNRLGGSADALITFFSSSMRSKNISLSSYTPYPVLTSCLILFSGTRRHPAYLKYHETKFRSSFADIQEYTNFWQCFDRVAAT